MFVGQIADLQFGSQVDFVDVTHFDRFERAADVRISVRVLAMIRMTTASNAIEPLGQRSPQLRSVAHLVEFALLQKLQI